MRIAVDTNVLVDAIADQDETQVCQKLLIYAAERKYTGVISANTVTDLHYILRKYIGDKRTRSALADLMTIFEVSPITGSICMTALGTNMKDFEDAVFAVSASEYGVDYIATNDKKFITEKGSPVPVLKAADILKSIENESMN